MNHDLDYDRDGDREDTLSTDQLMAQLQTSLDQEEEMMRTYLILAERIHDNDTLKNRLVNFAEGNAKRSRQLLDELSQD
ncbi:hypothetical protein [Halalkalibacter akibai]|uniref:Uncharacterized protein n=1 Tax=Halalkalibacter akibai (strain ATCC 43226 / DSM 21942 / CIP 109018 / JCM 9157 / 1139) TaxID=1236973 RepID=W4QNJ8_HALA3|nr:hypothetical protein [Halalkalibacter akibai]GAE33248.1 hypothetical protein JCM9157_241 [Halalkalibacter akibai JCM 9157]